MRLLSDYCHIFYFISFLIFLMRISKKVKPIKLFFFYS